jgi:hypothetical protein
MIMTRHEGRIWAENSNSGPSFSFVLPMRQSEVAQQTRIERVAKTDSLRGAIYADA